MIKADIVDEVVERLATCHAIKAVHAVDTIIDAMKDALCDGRAHRAARLRRLPGRDRKKGVGRNPKTGVEVAITPGRTVRFKPGKDLKNL